MQTDALIQRLSDDLTPVSHDDARTRIGAGLLAGAASSLLLLIVYGLRSDLDVAVKASAFWIKLLYTLTLGAGALLAALRLGRPGTAPPRWTLLIAPPVIGLATATAVQLNQLPAGLERTFWYGATWLECPLRVFLLSLPVLAGLIWSLRYLAVTRSREAGAAVGLAAGAIGATIYALHCSETSAGFVLVWYSVGLALCSGLGAVLGPRVFRW